MEHCRCHRLGILPTMSRPNLLLDQLACFLVDVPLYEAYSMHANDHFGAVNVSNNWSLSSRAFGQVDPCA